MIPPRLRDLDLRVDADRLARHHADHLPQEPAAAHRPAHMLGGFFVTPSVGNYAAWVPLFLAVALGAYGDRQARSARPSRARFPGCSSPPALESAVWFVAASGLLHGHFSLSGKDTGLAWLFQTILIVLIGAAVYAWGAANPERAELTVWNTRQTWQPVPFELAGHGRPLHHGLLRRHGAAGAVSRRPRVPRPDRPDRPAVRAADPGVLPLVRHHRAGHVGARRVHLERPHLAGRRPVRDGHLDRPRGQHRHHGRLLSAAGSARC